MLGYVQKAEMHSFPNMPIMWVVALVEVGQKKDFLQKSAEKTAILSDTNRDHLTLEGHNSLNFLRGVLENLGHKLSYGP